MRKPHPMTSSLTTTTKQYSAPSRKVAVEFLQEQHVTEDLVYIEVETPQGVFGTDRIGKIYDNGGLQVKDAPSQSEIADWEDLSETIHDAAGEGNLDEVRRLLDAHPNLVHSRARFLVKPLYMRRLERGIEK